MKHSTKKTGARFPFINRFLVGLIVALSLTLSAFEWTTIKTTINPKFEDPTLADDDEILPPITYQMDKVKKPKLLNKSTSDQLDIVKELTPPEPQPDPEPTPEPDPNVTADLFDPADYGMDSEEFPADDIDRIHVAVEIFAHYDNCAGLSGDELRVCSQNEISTRIKRNFRISERLKDVGGRQVVEMQFVVDKEGEIHSIKALQYTNKAIVADAIKAIETLPKMNPAKQQGRAVSLQMKIPIIVHIRN